MDPPFVQFLDFVQVNMIGRHDGQTTMNTFLYKYELQSQGGMKLDLKQIADVFLTKFWTGVPSLFREAHAASFSLQAITAQVIHPIRSIAWPAVPLAAEAPGMVAGASLPSGVAIVLRRRGNIGDRHNYGRIYLPGVSVTYAVASNLTQTAIDKLTPVVNTLAESVTVPGTDGNAFLYPYILRKGDIPNSREVTHGVVDKTVRYQRRREVGVGI